VLALFAIASAMVLLPRPSPVWVPSAASVSVRPLAAVLLLPEGRATLYGSGYVLLAFLQDGLVGQWRWLTKPSFWMRRPWDKSRRPLVHDGHVHRYVLEARWRHWCDAGHLPSVLRVRRPQRPLLPRLRKSALAALS